jgi:hypothetical protein
MKGTRKQQERKKKERDVFDRHQGPSPPKRPRTPLAQKQSPGMEFSTKQTGHDNTEEDKKKKRKKKGKKKKKNVQNHRHEMDLSGLLPTTFTVSPS